MREVLWTWQSLATMDSTKSSSVCVVHAVSLQDPLLDVSAASSKRFDRKTPQLCGHPFCMTILEPTWAWCEDSDLDQCSLFDMVCRGLQFIDNAGPDFLKHICNHSITSFFYLCMLQSLNPLLLESFFSPWSPWFILVVNRGWASERSQRTSGSLTSTGDPCRPNVEGWNGSNNLLQQYLKHHHTVAKVCDPEVNSSQSVN